MATNHEAAAREWMDKQCHIPAFDEIPDDDPTMLSLARAFERVALEARLGDIKEFSGWLYEKRSPDWILIYLVGEASQCKRSLAALTEKEGEGK